MVRNGKSNWHKCEACNKEFNDESKYCSKKCYLELRYREKIDDWKTGKISGLTIHFTVIPAVKRYLRNKFENKCCLCGWNKVNPNTKLVPLVADHIDGCCKNNKEENLRLICPNCDSLSATYGGANRGKGRSKLMSE